MLSLQFYWVFKRRGNWQNGNFVSMLKQRSAALPGNQAYTANARAASVTG